MEYDTNSIPFSLQISLNSLEGFRGSAEACRTSGILGGVPIYSIVACFSVLHKADNVPELV